MSPVSQVYALPIIDGGPAVAAGAESGGDAVPGFWSTIGQHTLKCVAWGDGCDDLAYDTHADGGFTVRYGTVGRPVGVLTHRADGDFEGATELVARGAPWTR